MRTFIALALACSLLVSLAAAQTPMPVIVPAVTPATAAQSPAAAAVTTASMQTTLKALQAIKATNDEILKQQAAALEKLDEMEKAAQEIRIYSKRG